MIRINRTIPPPTNQITGGVEYRFFYKLILRIALKKNCLFVTEKKLNWNNNLSNYQ